MTPSPDTPMHTPTPWTYGVRSDGSIWMSLGDPEKGPHRQFDFGGTLADAAMMCASLSLAGALEDLMRLRNDIEVMGEWSALDMNRTSYRLTAARVNEAMSRGKAALSLATQSHE